jgi:uncharacterized LabA/DUF88 family protein
MAEGLTWAFVDLENLERTAMQEYGSTLNYEALARAIVESEEKAGRRIAAIYAYGDFDRGQTGLQTALALLDIQARHIVTKTAHEYISGSVDVELSLDILQTLYEQPQITDFLLLSGDGDFYYAARRLRMKGKRVQLMGFGARTSARLRAFADRFTDIEQAEGLLRKVTETEQERRARELLSNRSFIETVLHLDYCERELNKDFIGLNYFRKRLIDRMPAADASDALTYAIELGLIETYQVPNPDDPAHPTSACRLARGHKTVQQILAKKER